jgi:hypothetical protein
VNKTIKKVFVRAEDMSDGEIAIGWLDWMMLVCPFFACTVCVRSLLSGSGWVHSALLPIGPIPLPRLDTHTLVCYWQ